MIETVIEGRKRDLGAARIEQAKRDWADGKFATIPGETELIPLPDH